MKPVILNTYKDKGGAAIAAGRITEAIKKEIPETTTQFLIDNNKRSLSGSLQQLRPYIDFGFGFLRSFKRIPYFPAVLKTSKLNRKIASENPDIVHFHWMQGGFFDFSTDSVPKGVPLVWTFHDLWPVTGGCAYPGECRGYQNNCGNCPLFLFPGKNDISYKSLRRKKEFFQSFSDIHIVTPSSWLQKRVKESPITAHLKTSVIHNGIDTETFKVINKSVARKKLGISDHKKIILFGAIGATTNPTKGFDILLETYRKMNHSACRLIVFGSDITYYPLIKDIQTLNRLYSAADVMVVPSREEVFGQTVIEAMASGTPVVAFNNGGPADIIDHKINGFLASPFSPHSLREGIDWILENNPLELGLKAKDHIDLNFHISQTASKYISLYNSLAQSEI
jgi:glycosyltransferase involved in cell wall biosynthesis